MSATKKDVSAGAAAAVRLPLKAFVRAGAKMRECELQDSELCAGERLRLAGFSAGRSVCARISGGGRIRFYWSALRSITPVLFPLSGKKKRLALCHVSIPRGSESPLVRSRVLVWLSDFVGSLRDCTFPAGDSDGVTTGAGYTKRNAMMCGVPFDINCFFDMIPRGIRWGSAPQTAPKSLRLSGLSSLDSWQCAFHAARGILVQRRLDRLQFMAGQVVLCCAAASVSGHCPLGPQTRTTAWRSARRASHR